MYPYFSRFLIGPHKQAVFIYFNSQDIPFSIAGTAFSPNTSFHNKSAWIDNAVGSVAEFKILLL